MHLKQPILGCKNDSKGEIDGNFIAKLEETKSRFLLF